MRDALLAGLQPELRSISLERLTSISSHRHRHNYPKQDRLVTSMHSLILLLATSFALAQDSTFLTVLPPPPASSDLDPVTTETTSYASVVSYASSAIAFESILDDGGISLITFVTKPPGPPETTVV